MTSEPRAFLALDLGAATTSVALLGRIAHRWRLIGTLAVPATIEAEAVVEELLKRARAADPELAAAIGVADDRAAADLPRIAVRSSPPVTLLVVSASARAGAPIAAAARRVGWTVRTTSLDRVEPLELTADLLDRRVQAVVLAAGDPPGPDERRGIPELVALAAAAIGRRPDLTVVLAGSMADHAPTFEEGERSGELVLGPLATAGDPPGSALAELLDRLRGAEDDSRRGIGEAAAALADAIDRRVEIVEIGLDGGLRAVASPGVAGSEARASVAIVADAALAPREPSDTDVDRAMGWATTPTDRHRLRDRLRELRLAPWADATGVGARLRLTAVRSALATLVEATPELSAEPAPDLLVVAGGAFAVAPGPAIALAAADVVRRPAVVAVAYDHARLLGPLGAIPDPTERRQVLADLADDLLAPLASIVIPAGIRAGHSAGRLIVRSNGASTEVDLVPGGLELVDLPPGEVATAELQFRDTVRLGGRGRRFAVDVSGGLGGLLLDLRDVPLRLPDRQERRRELLEAWQDALWVTRDR